ncbi:MAG TPA: PAS domain S-box protein [Pyrinomonadaceae bacterium]|jgi:PAS domain S-box-containing protein
MTQEKIQTAVSSDETARFWLAALIDSADDAIISKTLEGVITSWNNGAERIFGYRAEEVIGKSVSILIPTGQENEEPEILRRIRAGERVEHYETLRVRKDGSLVDISLTVSPIINTDGKIIGASKIARDISDLRQAEAAILESEKQLQLITNTIPALISYVDAEYRYRFVNRRYTDWFELSQEEIIGRHVREIIGEDAYAAVLPKMEKALSGEHFDFEQTMPYPGGEKIIHVNYIPDIDAAGRVKGFCALIQDVTESKKADALLRESEARFSKAFNASPLVLTISSLATGKLLEVNETFVEVTGFSREEAIGKTTLELGLWAKSNEREEEMEIVRQVGQIRNAEYLFHTQKGIIVGLLSAEHIEIGGESFALTVIQDITQRKKAVEKLRESEERYRLLFNSIDQGFCVCEVIFDDAQNPSDYRFLEVNPVFEKMTGIPKNQALAEKTARQLVPNLEDKWVKMYGQIALTGEPVHFVDTSNAMNNRWFEVYAFRIGDEPSRKVAIFFNNITERKLAENRLRESEENLRYTVELNPQIPWTANAEGSIESFSDRWLEMTGLKREEALGAGWAQVPHPDDREKMLIAWTHSIKTGEPYDIEHRIRLADGSFRWMRSLALPRRNGNDEIIRWYGTTEDIHKRKVVEESLRQNRERLQMAMDAAKIYSWEMNPATGQVVWSKNIELVIGFSLPSDYKGTINDFVYAEDREMLAQNIRRAIENREPYESEFRLVNPETGELIWLRGQGLVVEDLTGDRQPRFVGITQNINERKRAEQEREELLRREQIARQQAEEASRLKDEFLATVSHEIRTPLNAILGWSQMMMANKIRPQDMPGAIETIYRNAKSQAQLIEDILDVSRIITGKIRLEPQPVLLAPVIQTAVESLRPAIEAKNIRLHMHLDFEPRKALADPNRLQQVIWNLLSNAIKFTPEQGSVVIELASDGTQTKIIVSDTGKGINPEFLPFVFERFRQADGSSTRKHGGLGLGLAIVRHIVELHGGSVEVSSEGEDKGSTFTVCLPLSESVAGEATKPDNGKTTTVSNGENAAPIVSDGKIKGLRVLLVDDETDTLEMLSVALRQSGAEVKAELSAAAALEIIKQWPPDVIISDIAMPEEDGYSFIKKLRALPIERGGAIPAIALTAYVGIRERTQVLSSGFQMYVPKPFEPSELIAALANFV